MRLLDLSSKHVFLGLLLFLPLMGLFGLVGQSSQYGYHLFYAGSLCGGLLIGRKSERILKSLLCGLGIGGLLFFVAFAILLHRAGMWD